MKTRKKISIRYISLILHPFFCFSCIEFTISADVRKVMYNDAPTAQRITKTWSGGGGEQDMKSEKFV